jgi:membrane fusion protein, multidrug efflux system
VLVVPTDAIQAGQQGQYVFIVKNDMTVDMRPIAAGIEFGRETVVLKGVGKNEKVVTSGQLRLVPGAKVQLATNSAGAASSPRPVAQNRGENAAPTMP